MKSNGSDFGFFPCTFIGDNNQNDDDHGDDDDDDQDDDCKGEQQRVKVWWRWRWRWWRLQRRAKGRASTDPSGGREGIASSRENARAPHLNIFNWEHHASMPCCLQDAGGHIYLCMTEIFNEHLWWQWDSGEEAHKIDISKNSLDPSYGRLTWWTWTWQTWRTWTWSLWTWICWTLQ